MTPGLFKRLLPESGCLKTIPLLCLLLLWPLMGHAGPTREKIAAAMTLTDSAEQVLALQNLNDSSAEVSECFREWKEGGVLLHVADDGTRTAIQLTGDKDAEGKQAAVKYADGAPLLDPAGQPQLLLADDLETAETDSVLRSAMKNISDLLTLSHPDPAIRLRTVQDVGLSLDPEKLPALEKIQAGEKDPAIQRALSEAIALCQLRLEDPAKRIAGCKTLGSLGSIPSQDALSTLQREATAAGQQDVAAAAESALRAIASHVRLVNAAGTAFRGLSAGSVLLLIAIGLSITFGLMGVINMAHGEIIAIGAYTTWLTQNLFAQGIVLSPFGKSFSIPGFGWTGAAADSYFLVSLPCAFLTAALAGIALERCVIRFLYRRPLESLLATWGVSLLLQQLFRLTFGPNNVQVASPGWLSGNWTVNDVVFGWNRCFVIAFVILIVSGTSLLLRRTSLGLMIRAVMQNRRMAACMGVRTERINMLTFGLGSGLAGLAGAFLSQIGNVGPGMGERFTIDAFMTVVAGGVGHLSGTIISALGIGVADQSLQQILGNPVMGKILVLGAIILFLQFRPAGLFTTSSRSLDN